MDIVARTVLNYSHKYSGPLLSRLCKRSHHATAVNRAWALSKLRSFPERYKIFFSRRSHESDTIEKVDANQWPNESKERESIEMRSVLENSLHYKDTLLPPIKVVANVSFDELNELRSTDWSSKSANEILRALKLLTFSHLNGANYEPSTFYSICEACCEKLAELDDSQIKVLLQCLITLGGAPSLLPVKKCLKALNKECLKRYFRKNAKQLLLIADAFHQLGAHDSAYLWQVIRKLCKRPSKLSGKEFVQTVYYLNIYNIVFVLNIFEMECRLAECIQEITGNELGIIARGFFINKKGIRDRQVMSAIIRKTINSIQSMDSPFIIYIMRLLRYNAKKTSPESVKELLDTLTQELPRLSLPCLSHVMQTSGFLHAYNETLTNSIVKIALENMHLLSLLDIERIISGVCTVAPYTDYYTDICHKFLNEILSTYKTVRKNEVDKNPLSLVSILMFLSMRNIYVPELLQFVYRPETLLQKYNIRYMKFPRELLILHCSVQIELPQYEGPLLTPNWRNILLQKYRTKQHLATESVQNKYMMSEIIDMCKNKLGINVFSDHIIPYDLWKDIIFGVDEQNNPVDVELILSTMPKDSIKSVNNDELKSIKWHAITFVSSTLVLDHGGYVGYIQQKLRQLSILGYTPILIHEKEWKNLTEDEKEAFLRKLLCRDVCCSVAMK